MIVTRLCWKSFFGAMLLLSGNGLALGQVFLEPDPTRPPLFGTPSPYAPIPGPLFGWGGGCGCGLGGSPMYAPPVYGPPPAGYPAAPGPMMPPPPMSYVPRQVTRQYTVDRGSYQWVWVPNPVTTQVTETILEPRVVTGQPAPNAPRGAANPVAPPSGKAGPSMLSGPTPPNGSTPNRSLPPITSPSINPQPATPPSAVQTLPPISVPAAKAGSNATPVTSVTPKAASNDPPSRASAATTSPNPVAGLPRDKFSPLDPGISRSPGRRPASPTSPTNDSTALPASPSSDAPVERSGSSATPSRPSKKAR